MKKIFAILLAACMLLTMVACGAGEEKAPAVETPENEQPVQPTPEQETQPDSEQESQPTPEAGSGIGDIEVDENLIDVEITLPADYFEGGDEESIKAEVEESGFKSYKINEDGSVTYTMTKAKHKEMLTQMASEMDEMLSSMVTGEGKIPAFTSVEHNDNFSVIDIYVDTAVYTPMDAMYALVLFLVGAYYQAFEGLPEEDVDVVVSFIDSADGETVLDSSSYRTFMTNLEAEEQGEDGTEEPAA